MSLRAFHIFFIVISILLCAGFSYWAWSRIHAPVVAGFSGLAAFGLILYLRYFIRKKTALLLPLAVLLAPDVSHACAVCFGATDRSAAIATQRGILFLIGMTALVLAGVTYMTVRAIRSVGRND